MTPLLPDHSQRRLFTIGPVEMDEATLQLGGRPLPYFRTSEFSSLVLDVGSMIRSLIGTQPASRLAILTASGTAAMESAVISVFTRQDKLLVIEGGAFGRRFSQICAVHGIPYTSLCLGPDEELTADHLAIHDGQGLTGMLVNLHETSTGHLYNSRLIRDFCQANSLILVVDAIGCFLADPYNMDELGADVTIVSSQKGLALPPGLSLVAVTPGVYEQRVRATHAPSLYLDLALYFRDMERGQTPFTPAQGIIYQLHDKLQRVTTRGLQSYIDHSARLATDFRARLGSLPVSTPHYGLSNALTPILFPAGTAYDVFLRLKEMHAMYVTPSGGELKGTLLRVGHLGNLTTDDNAALAEALAEVLGS